jgi:hypothetical protein
MNDKNNCQWISRDIKPPLTKGDFGCMWNRNLVVLIDGVTVVKGTCMEYADGAGHKFFGDGFHGEWNVTHWFEVPPLPNVV